MSWQIPQTKSYINKFLKKRTDYFCEELMQKEVGKLCITQATEPAATLQLWSTKISSNKQRPLQKLNYPHTKEVNKNITWTQLPLLFTIVFYHLIPAEIMLLLLSLIFNSPTSCASLHLSTQMHICSTWALLAHVAVKTLLSTAVGYLW